MRKFSIAIFVFLLFTFAFSSFAQDETRVTSAWQVQKYDIAATLPTNANDRYLTAKATLNLQNVGNGAGSRLTLRVSEKAEVAAVAVNGAAGTFTKGEEKLDSARSLQRIIISLPSIPPNGTATVTIDYKLKVDENSGLNALSPANSQFLPLAFWYPTPSSQYAARGADFAPFHLTVNAANGETVVASGAANANSFEQKLNAQPFFVTGNWDAIDAKGVTVYLPKGAGEMEKARANELANLTIEAKTFIASLLGTSIETPLRIVAVRRGAGFADAGTMLLDYAAFRRQKLDSQTALAIAEAAAKMYLGNAKLVRGEGYGAIREGLARFVATQFIEKQFGKDAADIERLRQRTAYAAVAQRDAPLNRLTPLDDYFYAAAANKGAMIWRLLAKQIGQEQFFSTIRGINSLTLANIRAAFPAQKDLLDYEFDQVTDMNLLAGLPRVENGQTKVALRNLGTFDASVNVVGTTDKGEKVTVAATIPKTSFGEAVFNSTAKIVRAEVDADKIYPQTDYSDDIAPREFTDSDALVVIKRAFDKQDYAAAEKNARTLLNVYPHYDDARILLARSLAAQNKTAEAEKEFRAALDEKLPTARSLAWANEGLGELALKSNQNAQAVNFFDETIKANSEFGATLAARGGRNKLNRNAAIDESIKNYFIQFDKAAISNRKAEFDALIVPGEIPKFSGGIAGQALEWQTKILRVDLIDANTALVETNLNIKLLNKDAESGSAVFILSKIGGNWKLSGVEVFEVR